LYNYFLFLILCIIVLSVYLYSFLYLYFRAVYIIVPLHTNVRLSRLNKDYLLTYLLT